MLSTVNQKYFLLALIGLLVFSACKDPEVPQIEVPATYNFERNGQSSVSYTGQTDRLNQLAA